MSISFNLPNGPALDPATAPDIGLDRADNQFRAWPHRAALI
jgi:hypothetical protein